MLKNWRYTSTDARPVAETDDDVDMMLWRICGRVERDWHIRSFKVKFVRSCPNKSRKEFVPHKYDSIIIAVLVKTQYLRTMETFRGVYLDV